MLSIGEFSKICRVSTKTLRHYDSINLIKPIHINQENSYRYYDLNQTREMNLISKLKQYGFSLEKISDLIYSKDLDILKQEMKKKKDEMIKSLYNQEYVIKCIEKDIFKLERSIDIMKNNYEIKLTNTETMNIVSLRKNMGLKDFEQTFNELFELIGKNKYTICGVPLAIYHDEEFNPENTDIETGMTIKESEGENIRRLEGGLCCYTTHIGVYDDFTPAYSALGAWIEENGYEYTAPPYEKYVRGYEQNIPPEEYVTEIYFPIKKK